MSLGGGEECQIAVWGEFFPSGFVEIGRIKRREVCDVLCMVVYVCSDGVEEIGVQLRGDKGLNLMVEIIRTTTAAGYEEDWFRLLVSRLCVEEFYLPLLFSKLYLDDISGNLENSKSSDKIFSTEQVFLLRTVSEVLNERLKEVTVTTDFAVWLWGIFRRAVQAVDFFSRSTSGLPTGLDAVDILGYSLTILRDICAQGGSTDVINGLVSSGILEFLLSLLRDLEPPATIRKAMKQNDVQVSSIASSSFKLCPYKGFRRDIVGVIGNCAFGRQHVQDKIRENKGILLLLQQCVTDEENPYLREWGIWSVRNLLEGNIENQKEVAELELQESIDVPELSGLGIRVEVDKNTRRAKLVNVS